MTGVEEPRGGLLPQPPAPGGSRWLVPLRFKGGAGEDGPLYGTWAEFAPGGWVWDCARCGNVCEPRGYWFKIGVPEPFCDRCGFPNCEGWATVQWTCCVGVPIGFSTARAGGGWVYGDPPDAITWDDGLWVIADDWGLVPAAPGVRAWQMDALNWAPGVSERTSSPCPLIAPRGHWSESVPNPLARCPDCGQQWRLGSEHKHWARMLANAVAQGVRVPPVVVRGVTEPRRNRRK